MRGYYVKNIYTNRGKPRIWLQGSEVYKAGLSAGDRFDVRIKEGSIILEACKDGSRVVSKKTKNNRDIPIIDINSETLLKLFEGMSAIRMVQREGEIILMPLASELKVREREGRLIQKLRNKEEIAMGSLSHGGGVLSHAIEQGLADKGIKSKLLFANEIRSDFAEHAQINNNAWNKNTIPLVAPIQELAFDRAAVEKLPKVEVLEAGLPCSGASIAGRTKRKLAHPEDHPEVGHLVVAALVIIARVNPPIFLLENVIPYSNSASASILRNQLSDLGYTCHETHINGAEFNEIENRKRWCLVAVSRGINFSWDMLQKPEKRDVYLSEILDPIPEDSPVWSAMEGMKLKQERDAAAGKGFKMQSFTPDATSIGTFTKGYAKRRLTDNKLSHPTDPDLLRQFTPDENARAKGIPESIYKGLSDTIAHELLGQSVSYGGFRAAGATIGQTILEFAKKHAIDLSQPDNIKSLAVALTSDFLDVASEAVQELHKPARGATYEGVVTVKDLGFIVTDIGSGVGVIHDASISGDDEIKVGERIEVNYPKKSANPSVQFLDRVLVDFGTEDLLASGVGKQFKDKELS